MEKSAKKKVPAWVAFMQWLTKALSEDFLGGPKIIKFAWVVNFQKGGTFLFVGLLMWYYQNFSTAAWIYLALHGTYGLCWLLKDLVFPDHNWEKMITFGGAFMAFAAVLGPYWAIPFLLISDVLGPNHPDPSNALLATCVILHTLGVVIMMTADIQKYYTLKYKRGLITEGMFKYIRHPNYLGEIMLYGSYALMVQHWIPWAILLWVWIGIFTVNMIAKEASMSRYPEWAAYKKRSGWLLPFL